MTPYQMAIRECANYVAEGCLSTEGGVCLLREKKICKYFERSVLDIPLQPGAESNPHYQDYLNARQTYLRQHRISDEKVEVARTCPDCGKALAARKRVCSAYILTCQLCSDCLHHYRIGMTSVALAHFGTLTTVNAE